MVMDGEGRWLMASDDSDEWMICEGDKGLKEARGIVQSGSEEVRGEDIKTAWVFSQLPYSRW